MKDNGSAVGKPGGDSNNNNNKYLIGSSLSGLFRVIWNLEMLVLRRGENRSTRRKTSRSKDEKQQQTQPTFDAESGNQTQATLVGGLRGRQMLNHCAIPAPLTVVSMGLALGPVSRLWIRAMYRDISSADFWSQRITLSPKAQKRGTVLEGQFRGLSWSAYLEDQPQDRCHILFRCK